MKDTFARIVLPVLSLALFAACQAHMMETRGDRLQLLRTSDGAKGGVIRYLANGLGVMRRARRADAEKQMRKFCDGPYLITAEGPRSKFGSAMPTESKVSFEVDQWWYIDFQCATSAHR